MGRKFRSTEVSGNMNIESNGQHMHATWFCINCHASHSNSSVKHYNNCSCHDVYAIPSTAEVPRKTASKRIWNIFKEQFVFAKPIGWWFYNEDCWYFKHNKNSNE